MVVAPAARGRPESGVRVRWHGLSPTDLLLAGYLLLVTAIILARGSAHGRAWLLLAHGGFASLLWLFTRLRPPARIGRVVHDFYPLVLLAPLYAEIEVLNVSLGLDAILAHDASVQRWEAAVFGTQVSFEWIRAAPSVFWSGLLHLAYLVYYPIVVLTAPALALAGRRDGARRAIFAMMIAYVACYAVFVTFPVAGPNYAFPHPTGPVRDVWSARMVYAALEGGSSVGAAFPSSHVAATVAVTLGALRAWRPLGAALLVPCALQVVAVVYCQMHYGIDAATGLGVGVAAAYLAGWVWPAVTAESAPTISS